MQFQGEILNQMFFFPNSIFFFAYSKFCKEISGTGNFPSRLDLIKAFLKNSRGRVLSLDDTE